MSGKPWPEGVTEAIALMTKINTLNPIIDKLRKDAEHLLILEQEWSDTERALRVLLEQMDLNPGNYGYAARMAWFLKEMQRQVAIPHDPNEIVRLDPHKSHIPYDWATKDR